MPVPRTVDPGGGNIGKRQCAIEDGQIQLRRRQCIAIGLGCPASLAQRNLAQMTALIRQADLVGFVIRPGNVCIYLVKRTTAVFVRYISIIDRKLECTLRSEEHTSEIQSLKLSSDAHLSI